MTSRSELRNGIRVPLLDLVKIVLPELKRQGWHLVREGDVPHWFERVPSMRSELYRKKKD